MKKLLYTCAIALLSCSLYFCAPKAEEKTSVVDNGPAMKASLEAMTVAMNMGKLDALDTLIATDMVDHYVDTAMHLPPGLAGVKQMLNMYLQSSPDLKQVNTVVMAEGDKLMVFGTLSGTNTGPMMGMPATNKAWSAEFCDVVRFDANMKMAEHWGVMNELKMMKDLGMMPSGPPPAEKKRMK